MIKNEDIGVHESADFMKVAKRLDEQDKPLREFYGDETRKSGASVEANRL